MNIFVTIEPAFKEKEVNFYSVRFDGSDHLEIDDFITFFEEGNEEDQIAFEELIAFLGVIGDRGAFKHLFRHEGDGAEALPRKFLDQGAYLVSPNNPIRLYCIRINTDVVILCNGGIKTTRNPNDCDNVSRYFKDVRAIARSLDKAFIAKELTVEGYYLKHVDGDPIRLEIR